MRYIAVFIWIQLFISCGKWNDDGVKGTMARVNDTYLYKEDVKELIMNGVSKEDSANIINTYINGWATKQLLIDQAKVNLSDLEMRDLDRLVEDYRNTLYINAYKDALISKSIDTKVSDEEMNAYYEQNIENFNLNRELVKIRYLHLPTDYNDIVATKKQFDRFKEEDEEDLINRKLEFIGYSFNDSLWLEFEDVLHQIPILRQEEKKNILKEGKYIQLSDSLGIYMVKIDKLLDKGVQAPLEYIKPTIRQIILNKRKLELIKNLEKDITKDAIKNKQFEVYN
ncbi:peptidyl-prolyl cis-trans isomerase [Aquimarina hainanensis]|uniref:Peptidyl-prolyl cis-trans isomerase n=1 Tax=Aquimarina hainanensis TaxID=1578017 RepID=A0ABW5N8C9_9FLAO